MALNDALQTLREFDINDVDFNNIGTLPLPVKIVAWVLVFILIVGLGWYSLISDRIDQLETVSAKEQSLREEYKKKAFDAANLDALRKQMQEMEQAFGAMLSQLPSDTEVPGLLEDVSNRGVTAGLKFDEIQLQAERIQEFYVELPISIKVQGTYHDFGTFVSGIAGLPRIVTMGDFSIQTNEAKDGKSKEQIMGPLVMSIQASTYRYKDEADIAKENAAKAKESGKKSKNKPANKQAKG